MKKFILVIFVGLVSWMLVALVSAQPTPVRVVIPNTKWETSIVSLPTLKQIPFLILTSTPPRLKWQAKPGKYRVVVSDDGSVYRELIFIDVWKRFGWDEFEVCVPVPTNRFYKLVAPL